MPFANFPARFLAIVIAVAAPVAHANAQDADSLGSLAWQDARLATIADRLQVANAALCTELMPAAGFLMHSRDQYSETEEDPRFADGPLAVAALAPGSPAAVAGLQQGDVILAINARPVLQMVPQGGHHIRGAAHDWLMVQRPDAPLVLSTSRGGSVREIAIEARPGCRSLVEIASRKGARSDGRVIQIGYDLASRLSDDQLAVVFAHELAHTVLQHRRRKEAAGIGTGLLAEVGRNQRANREAEVEADRMSPHLLANAGYDPAIAPAFWRSGVGREVGGGVVPSFVYPSSDSRGELIAREVERYLWNRAAPSWPGHLLALRDRPFSGD